MTTKQRVLAAMRSKYGDKFRSVGSNSWQSCSPFRNGDNETAFLLTIEQDEVGGYKDFVTGDKGTLYDVAACLKVETPNGNGATNPIDKTDLDKVPDEPPAPPTKKDIRSFESLEEYAAHQGVPVEAFKKAGCHIVQHKNASHIAFPCADKINRLRRMDGNKPKWYPQKSGATQQLYGWRDVLKIRTQVSASDPLILTNGQPSVIVAQHFGLAAFCLTDGENKPIPDAQLLTIEKELDKGITLYIAKDNDPSGELGTDIVIKQLLRYGPQIKQIRFKGDKGYDLANHCKRYGEASLAQLLKLEVPIQVSPKEETIKDLSQNVGNLARIIHKKEGDEAAQHELARLHKIVKLLEVTHANLEVVDDAFQEPYEIFNTRLENPRAITGFKTSHQKLDYAIGGFNKRAAHRLLASTSAGKSLLMATWAYSFATQAPGLIVSYESGSLEFIFRMVAAETRLPFGDIMKAGQLVEAGGEFKFQSLNPLQVEGVRKSFKHLGKWNRMGRFKFPKKAPPTPRALYSFAESCKEQYGIEWMIIDSLNNISVPGAGQQESMALAAINSETMAVDFDLAVIDTVQAGRATKGRDDKKLNISDGKWSSEIEEKAHVHMSLYNHWVHVDRGDIVYKTDADMRKDEADYPRDSAEITINKARGSGVVGRKITLEYVPGAGFYNYDKRR